MLPTGAFWSQSIGAVCLHRCTGWPSSSRYGTGAAIGITRREAKRRRTHTHSDKLTSATRVRFAPSPTGYLHLGGLRTALFNYLLAKKETSQGAFVLRIEDTDRERLVPDATSKLKEDLEWCGLYYDEFYVQSERTAIYKEHTEKLLVEGKAYRCFCSPERLASLRKSQRSSNLPTGYDRHCRHLEESLIQENLSNGVPYTVRFKVPDGSTAVKDLVHGEIVFQNRALDDTIILKSDGLPTYHLANVVDDHLMRITHVLRGEEWVSSTPKHLLLYSAFKWEPPQYAHLPLLVNKSGGKLSKRQDDVNIGSLREKGYLPSALLNFVALLGWGVPQDSGKLQVSSTPSELNFATHPEFLTMDTLLSRFSLQINKHPAAVSYDKLNYLNHLHIQHHLSHEGLRPPLVQKFRKLIMAEIDCTSDLWTSQRLQDDAYFEQVVDAVKDRIHLVTDFKKFATPFFVAPDISSPTSDALKLLNKLPPKHLASVSRSLLDRLTEESDSVWTENTIRQLFLDVSTSAGVGFIDVVKPVRAMVTGSKSGVDLVTVLKVVGLSECQRRIERAVQSISSF
ncbi:Glutamate--tRNA ligase mitochondrial [Gaertneriomyces sp. JEL0708]|nr:Glutamate--tRNA ligase mitochondrial [Gaertneriomyces sp. JEL0708]